MRIKTTRYGLSPRVGGWDDPGDYYTDQWLGDGKDGHTLTTASCALTKSAADLLGARPGDIIHIVWNDKYETFRRYDDTAPEDDPRVDVFYPYMDAKMQPDFGEVSVYSSPKIS
jgi:hypothetical protein